MGTNVSTNYCSCPADPKKTLGIKLPFLVMIIKNMKKYFTFEVQVLDDKNVRRRFRASNYQSTTRVKPFICTMPMRLDEGWNQIQFNLSDFTRRAYGTNYIETLRVQIHANCRLRRIYFSDRLYSEEELPPEFKLFLPVQKGGDGGPEALSERNLLRARSSPSAGPRARSGTRRVFPSRFSRRCTRPCKFFCAGRLGRPVGSLVEAFTLLHRKQCPCRPDSTQLRPRRVLFAEFFSPPFRSLPGSLPAASGS